MEEIYHTLQEAERAAYLKSLESQRPKPIEKTTIDTAIALAAPAAILAARTASGKPFEPVPDDPEDRQNELEDLMEDRIKEKRHMANMLEEETRLDEQLYNIKQRRAVLNTPLEPAQRRSTAPEQVKKAYPGNPELEQERHQKLLAEIAKRRSGQKEED